MTMRRHKGVRRNVEKGASRRTSITSMKSSSPTSKIEQGSQLSQVRAMLRHNQNPIKVLTLTPLEMLAQRNRVKGLNSTAKMCTSRSAFLSTKHCTAQRKKLHTLKTWSARLAMGPGNTWAPKAVLAILAKGKASRKTHSLKENPSVTHVVVMEH